MDICRNFCLQNKILLEKLANVPQIQWNSKNTAVFSVSKWYFMHDIAAGIIATFSFDIDI